VSPASAHHRARRLALQGLCCLDVQGQEGMGCAMLFVRDSREDESTVAEAETILHGTFQAYEQTDAMLAGESRHWDVGRMALVDRNILRLALWEMLNDRAPRKVVISEALRLAREFSAAESYRFINGVLDAAARRMLDAGGQSDAEPPGESEESSPPDAPDQPETPEG